ncbi:DUF3006 domain-containing protein [Halosolutus halophilus]|uniref:DUF3006 domain-containing protein n=1 Tax=Halosolutus halophilus TaxID=1552990 RepID=UPI0022351430|nr:DUF3006 domain-containing protein [Halosolutus halophilus]
MAANFKLSRRGLVRTLGTGIGATTVASTSIGARTGSDADESAGAERYVAVVDRIVDDRHVVLLLEADGELVDQHVEPASKLADVEEGDVLHVVIRDGDRCTYQHLPNRSGDPAAPDSGRDS